MVCNSIQVRLAFGLRRWQGRILSIGPRRYVQQYVQYLLSFGEETPSLPTRKMGKSSFSRSIKMRGERRERERRDDRESKQRASQQDLFFSIKAIHQIGEYEWTIPNFNASLQPLESIMSVVECLSLYSVTTNAIKDPHSPPFPIHLPGGALDIHSTEYCSSNCWSLSLVASLVRSRTVISCGLASNLPFG